jgi:hypothetical protein
MATAMITPDLYARAAKAMCTDDLRPNLCGVRIEPLVEGGILLVSSDGTTLAAIRDPDGWCDEATTVRLDRNMMQMIGRKRIAASTRILIDGDHAALVDRGEADAEFPDDLVTTTCEMLDQVTRFGERLRYLQFRGAQNPYPYADWRAAIPTEFGGQGRVNGRRIGLLAEILGDPMRFSQMTIDFTPDGRMAIVIPITGAGVDGYGLVASEPRETTPAKVAAWFQRPAGACEVFGRTGGGAA